MVSKPRADHADAQDVLAAGLRATHLLAENVHVVLGDCLVLRDVSLTVSRDERVGLIGENGRGKSTLLRVLASELPVQRGQVVRAVSGRVGFLPQQPGFPVGATVEGVLVEANAEVTALAERMRAVEEAMGSVGDDLTDLLSVYGNLQEEFASRGGWEVEARTGEVLDVFGLGGVDRRRTAETLSGGERARLALAALVLTEPAGLLLDEPTNHLDDRGVGWLVRWLSQYRGPCLIASHDRVLLDAAVTAIVDLDGPRGVVVRYGGGYRDYLDERAVACARWQQRYNDWCRQVATARQRLDQAGRAGDGFRAMRDNNKLAYNAAGSAAEAAVARATRSARRQLQQWLDDAVPRPPEPLRFAPPDPGEAPEFAELPGGVLLKAEGIVVGDVVRGVDLELSHGSRYVVTGPNGAGKSTLLSVLVGERTPDRGMVTHAPGLRIGYLPQESAFAGEGRGLLEAFAAHRRAHCDDAAVELTRFGLFGHADFDVPVIRLSVGQQRRLALALLFAGRPHLLLLDEPTNHLSLVLVEQLEEAVERFAGPVVVVTHDQALRNRHPERVRELAGGRLVGPS
jgi:macrolide transport system ATP-binding/permease protein